MKRRHFLQSSAALATSLGLSQTQFFRQSQRLAQALTQPTPRKLALLVGINQYPKPIRSLRGCLTDVELQRELLIHRFGFRPQDILTLTSQTAIAPTRQNILDVFETHLIQQAKPGDVVVFHYSGHGSRVQDPHPISPDRLSGVLVPIDYRQASQGVNSILGQTLFLRLSALQTENVTTILDSCYSAGAFRDEAGLRIRSIDRGDPDVPSPSPIELADRDRWLKTLQLSPAEFQRRRTQGIAKGVMLGATQRNQVAADTQFDGFEAGAFTYLLTRHLWEITAGQTLDRVFLDLAPRTETLAKASNVIQVPTYAIAPSSPLAQQPIYLTPPTQPPAEAVVRSTQGSQIEFWLGGLSPQSLAAFDQEAVLTALDAQANPIGQIRQTGRKGLIGYGQLEFGTRSILQPGTLLREKFRAIPNNLTLRVGLEAPLDRQLPRLQQALQTTQALPVSRLELFALTPDCPVDYILRANEADRLEILNVDRQILPDALKSSTVSAIDAHELAQRLQLLLAGKILQTLNNGSASALKLRVDVLDRASSQLAANAVSRGAIPRGTSSAAHRALPVGSEIELHITNEDDRPLHIAVLAIASNGDLTVLHPLQWDTQQPPAPLAPQKTRILPSPTDRVQFILDPPAGLLAIHTLASTDSLQTFLRSLQAIAQNRGTRSGTPLSLEQTEPLALVGRLLESLDRSAPKSPIAQIDSCTFALLTTRLQVVESS